MAYNQTDRTNSHTRTSYTMETEDGIQSNRQNKHTHTHICMCFSYLLSMVYIAFGFSQLLPGFQHGNTKKTERETSSALSAVVFTRKYVNNTYTYKNKTETPNIHTHTCTCTCMIKKQTQIL